MDDVMFIGPYVLFVSLIIFFCWEAYKKYATRRRWRQCRSKNVIRDEANWCAVYKCTDPDCDWWISIPLKEDKKEVRHP